MKWKILFVVLLTAGAIYYIYPPKDTINLGLDLQGGIHIVLKVEMDEAMEAELVNAKSNVESIFKDESVEFTSVDAQPEALEGAAPSIGE